MKEFIKEYIPTYCTTLRYEDLSNLEAGKAVIKDAVSNWERFGFLNGIDDEVKKEQVAVAFDNMAHDIIFENERIIKLNDRYNFNFAQDDEEKHSPKFDVIILPLIRRVICKTDNFTYDKFVEYLERLSYLAINYDGYEFEGDIEAEICAFMSCAIEEMFNNLKNKK
jgi:hypothetical protein